MFFLNFCMRRSQSHDMKYYQKIPELKGFTGFQLIGRGSFGTVYKAINSKNIQYAIKFIKLSNRKEIKLSIQNQLQALRCLNHENIVKFYQITKGDTNYSIVMELCQTDLITQMNNKRANKQFYTQNQATNIIIQIAKGLQYIHQKKFVHRDLKPANILIKQGVVKIADFGLSKSLFDRNQLLRTYAGTFEHMCPQILQGNQYTSKCDVWSLGVIYYQLLFGHLPWYICSKNERDLALFIKKTGLGNLNGVSQKTKRILKGMLQVEQKDRYSITQVLNQLVKNEIKQTSRTYHFTTVQKLLKKQIEQSSMKLYGRNYNNLVNVQKDYILSRVCSLINQEHHQLLNYFVTNRLKLIL